MRLKRDRYIPCSLSHSLHPSLSGLLPFQRLIWCVKQKKILMPRGVWRYAVDSCGKFKFALGATKCTMQCIVVFRMHHPPPLSLSLSLALSVSLPLSVEYAQRKMLRNRFLTIGVYQRGNAQRRANSKSRESPCTVHSSNTTSGIIPLLYPTS